MNPLLILSAAIAPYFLWFVEYLLPYPYFVEEIAKLILVWLLLGEKVSNKSKIYTAIAMGYMFALTESILYLLNILQGGTLATFVQRLIFTTILHSITFLVILLPGLKKKRYAFLGFFLAIIIHFVYNQVV